jgi:hypothetical protein
VSSRKYENETPLDSVTVALDLLYHRWNDGSTRDLHVRYARRGESYIAVGYHHDWSDSTWYYYEVTSSLPQRLLAEHLVKGKPQWGYTDMHELSISDAGSSRFHTFMKEQELDYESGRFVDDKGASWRKLLARGLP